MSTEKHVEGNLVAYLDGEIAADENARIKAHLMTCDRCRGALDELRLLRQDIGATLDVALTPVRLSPQADDRIRQVIRSRLEPRPVWWQALWQRRGLISQAVMALFIVFISVTTLRVMTPSAPVPVHETIVLGQDRFAPGSQGALRVVVQSLGSALPSASPVSGVEVIVNLVRASGSVHRLYTGRTDSTGSAAVTFIVPDTIEGQAELVVETTSSAGTERIVRPIHIVRSHKIFLGSDKPVYRPGQSVFLRALVLDAVTGLPAAGEALAFQVLADEGTLLFEKNVNMSTYGIGYTEFQLPESVDIGSYTIRAGLGDMVVERLIEVNLYPPPAFHITLESVETYLMPGDRIHGSIECSYFFGKPVHGSVRITAFSGDDVAIAELTGVLNEEGVFGFHIDLPDSINADAITVVASVLDTSGQIEGIQRVLPLSTTPLLIKAIPESGRLKPGVENIVYLMTVYPDGLPAQTDLVLTVNGQQSHLQTDAYGMAVYRYIPQASTDLHVVAQDTEGHTVDETITLAADADARSLLLRADRAAYTVGETMHLETLVAADDIAIIYLDVIRSGQLVAVLSTPVMDNGAVFVLDLDANLTGALNLRAYAIKDGSVLVQDSRLVVVDPAGNLDITVTADRESYKPGDTAHLSLSTALADRDGTRAPVQGALGIAVVDTSVLSLDMLPPGFARTYFLMDNALLGRRGIIPGFDPPALLEGEEPTRQAQDVAAQAAWAGLQNTIYTAPSSVRIEGTDEDAGKRTSLASNFSWLLVLLPLGTSLLVIRGLMPSGVFWHACRRLGWGLLAVTVLSPVMIAGLLLGLLLPWLGAGLVVVLLLIVTVLMIAILTLSWAHHDTRMQLIVVMVGAYIVVAICTLILAALSAGPTLGGVVFITALFLVLLTSLFVLGQGLVLEGRRLAGWLLSLLVIFLVLLAISLPGVPQLRSNLSQTISNPLLYSGPVGWLSGCAPAYHGDETEAPMETVEKEVEMTEMPAAPTPSPMPTAMPESAGTATPVTIPVEAYPFRQLFPETLFWAPEVETSADGTLNLDIKMADSLTTWRLTALGTTQDGDIGAAVYDLLVFQDFFVDVQTPVVLQLDQTSIVTLTVYNYLGAPQTVHWEIEPSEDYIIETPPQNLTLDANSVASTTFKLVPQRTGNLLLQITAVGDTMVDIVRMDLEVTAP